VVALSRCEAEYIAATSVVTQALWLACLLSELLGRKTETIELKVDNKSALALPKNPIFHERSKHIRIKYHFIWSRLEEGSVKAGHISTEDQLADIITKSLGRVKFHELRVESVWCTTRQSQHTIRRGELMDKLVCCVRYFGWQASCLGLQVCHVLASKLVGLASKFLFFFSCKV
jgi:hypothetical protein